jgi:pimeloyl-ACP methyl ester carboxylesterase
MKKLLHFLFAKSIGLYINILSYVFPEKALQLAYGFFSEPRKGKLSKDNLPKTLQKAETETFYHNGENFQIYTWKGNDTIILLVHGWESNSSRWEKLLPYLKESGSTIIAIDAPAHGLSSGKEFSIPKYAEYINIIVKKFKPHYLIGHSMGGKTCLYYQYKYQNPSIEKIVVLGSPSDFKILLHNYISLLSLNSKVYKSLLIHYLILFRIEIDYFSGQLFAANIDLKGLVVHDINDKVVLFEEGKKIANSWKNANFIETSGLGHSLHDEELYKKVSAFLFNPLTDTLQVEEVDNK